jgi:hypothetical protein
VVDLHAEVLFGLVVEVKQSKCTLPGNGERVEDMISAVDREVCLDRAGLLEGHVGADDAVELRLNMSVRDEEKREGFLRRRKSRERRGGDGCGKAGRSEQGEELSAAGRVHPSMINPRSDSR